MLPPKLAQTIINLAGKHVLPSGAMIDPEHPTNKNPRNALLLDPFCGTGVILQEALLMGYDVYGTDLEPRMIDYTGENLDWLADQYDLSGREMRIEEGDATKHTWEPAPDLVAAETYLGRPFTSAPDRETLERTVTDCNQILRKFLTNLHGQLAPGTRLCLAIPAWQTAKDKFKHLPLPNHLNELGFERVQFQHAQTADLLYYRADQIVGRELLVITVA
jgi:tRNA G10  N-methylase Trm11